MPLIRGGCSGEAGTPKCSLQVTGAWCGVVDTAKRKHLLRTWNAKRSSFPAHNWFARAIIAPWRPCPTSISKTRVSQLEAINKTGQLAASFIQKIDELEGEGAKTDKPHAQGCWLPVNDWKHSPMSSAELVLCWSRGASVQPQHQQPFLANARYNKARPSPFCKNCAWWRSWNLFNLDRKSRRRLELLPHDEWPFRPVENGMEKQGFEIKLRDVVLVYRTVCSIIACTPAQPSVFVPVFPDLPTLQFEIRTSIVLHLQAIL